MNAAVILIVSLVALVCGYLFYGRWLAKEWGIDPARKTPSYEQEDGVDYYPAKAPVLMGHHFSSIAGAGPINGPIQAAIFGWVPVMLWVLIGGIFFGSVHDFGALFASLRHKGHSIGVVISDTMGKTAKRLFLVFAYLTLLLVVAAFASIVASTFGTTNSAGKPLADAALAANESTAVISVLFIFLALIFGFAVYRRGVGLGPASAVGVIGICIVVALGLNWHPFAFTYQTWMWLLGGYIFLASVAPVWILLQPRDYLSSFLLYFMMIVAFVGILGAAFSGNGHLDIPAFTGFTAPASNGLFTSGTLFPALFVTIACGAISGFHSLVASGTTAKQLSSEADALPIGYGAMLVECALAIASLCAVGFVWDGVSGENPAFASPTAVFAGGISQMIGTFVSSEQVVTIAYSMLILAVSVFCLTSLDTATRLARYMFQEFWIDDEVDDMENLPVWKKVLVNPFVSTIITVVLGIALGMTGYAKIWPLFGAANQLLAALGLMAVCTWLGHVGRNNRMFYIPMAFMLVVTVCSLIQTIMAKLAAASAGVDPMWAYIQAGLAVVLVVLAVILAVTSVKTIMADRRA